ncbi:MAG: hypothetical protein AMXMBFR61_22160 [Fimbriimonadales bacterium]
MPIPYHRIPHTTAAPLAAYLLVTVGRSAKELLAGLLVIDGRGQPVEFVHNSIEVPSGLLWPEPGVEAAGSAALAHSLFEACRAEPDLLVVEEGLGTPQYVRTNVAPLIPTCVVSPPESSGVNEFAWVNDAPSQGAPATLLLRELVERGFLREPFERVRRALAETYGTAQPET